MPEAGAHELRPDMSDGIELLLGIWALLNVLIPWWFARIPR
jgi:hypothetical protein